MCSDHIEREFWFDCPDVIQINIEKKSHELAM